jgi:hypothetical protein
MLLKGSLRLVDFAFKILGQAEPAAQPGEHLLRYGSDCGVPSLPQQVLSLHSFSFAFLLTGYYCVGMAVVTGLTDLPSSGIMRGVHKPL